MNLAALILVCLGANAYDESFSQANAAYEKGSYEAAIEGYQRLVAASVEDPAVFYNLGNAWYRQGALGQAILNYERAIQADPNYESAHINLRHALEKTHQALERPEDAPFLSHLFSWQLGLSRKALGLSALFAWGGAWLLLALRQLSATPHRLRMGAGILFAVALLLGSGFYWRSTPSRLAVVVQEELPLYYGAGEENEVRLQLYAGDRLILEKEEGLWRLVRLAKGDRGWVRAEGLRSLGPPYALESLSPDALHGDEKAAQDL